MPNSTSCTRSSTTQHHQQLSGRRDSARRTDSGRRRQLLHHHLCGRIRRVLRRCSRSHAWLRRGGEDHTGWRAERALQLPLSTPVPKTTPNGMFPVAGLLQGPDGNFYGVASGGGSSGTDFCQPGPEIFGCGTIFKLTPSGHLTLLYSFCGGYGCGSYPPDGADPRGRLVYSGGYLYGTTQQGGEYNGVYNSGTIFRISLSGAYQIMHYVQRVLRDGRRRRPRSRADARFRRQLLWDHPVRGNRGQRNCFQNDSGGRGHDPALLSIR